MTSVVFPSVEATVYRRKIAIHPVCRGEKRFEHQRVSLAIVSANLSTGRSPGYSAFVLFDLFMT